MVDDIGIVGKNGEIRRSRFHRGQSFHGFVGNRISGGIGIRGNKKDSFDRLRSAAAAFSTSAISGPSFVILTWIISNPISDKQQEMPVIAGHGDDHFRLVDFAPGRGASDQTAQERPHQNLGEDEQAGIVADHCFFRFRAQNAGK